MNYNTLAVASPMHSTPMHSNDAIAEVEEVPELNRAPTPLPNKKKEEFYAILFG